MLRRLLLVALLVLASCASDVNNLEWCYNWAFTGGALPAGVNVVTGSHVPGAGILSDSSGLLSVNWVHSGNVTPWNIKIIAARAPGVVGPVSVTANAIVFGAAVAGSTTIDLDRVELNVGPDVAGANGSSVNITIDASAQFVLELVGVGGRAPNPFDRNDCSPETATPTLSTPTAQPSATATPSPTDGPSPTPNVDLPCFVLADWINASNTYTWDGSSLDYERTYTWQRPPQYGSSTLFFAGYIQELSFSNVVGVNVFTGMEGQAFIQPRNIVALVSSAYGSSMVAKAAPLYAQYPAYTHVDLGAAGVGFSGDYSVYFRIWGGNPPWAATTSHRVRLVFVTDNPAYCSQISTPTPTATRTPGPTATRTPLPTSAAIRPTRTPIVPPATRTAAPLASATSTVAATVGPPPATFTLIPPAETLPPQVTPELGDPVPGPTSGEMTVSDFLLWIVNQWTSFVTWLSSLAKWFVEAWTNFLNWLAQFAKWLANAWRGLGDWLGQLANWLAGTAYNIGVLFGNLLALLGGFFGAVVGFFLELWDIARLIAQIVWGFIVLLFAWLSLAVARAGGIFSVFFAAPATPIPSLPLCDTAPLQHNLCAIYYFLDFTLLAQGTPGAFIVPLITIVINLLIILGFVRFIQKIISRGESIADA